MNKLKKILTSIIVGVCSLVPYNFNASAVVIPESALLQSGKVVYCDWLSDYMEKPVYIDINNEESISRIFDCTSAIENPVYVLMNESDRYFQPYFPYMNTFVYDEEMFNSLKEKFPNLDISVKGHEYVNIVGGGAQFIVIEYPEDTTLEYKISVANYVKENFNKGWGLYITLYESESFRFAGDVDNDNRLTADDASYVLEYYAKVQTDKLGEYEESRASELALYGDYDGDGIVDANDASNILAVYSKNQAN